MNATSEYHEAILLQQFLEGSKEAFTQLYQHYCERLYYNILAMVKDELTAEELVQDIFASLWQKRETLTINKSFAGYLFTTSRNRVYDFFQKVERDQKLYDRIKASAISEYSHVEEALFSRENADLLQKAIASLPPQRRRAFELCKIEGHSYKEVSELMNVSLSTVKDHMAHAREAIREYISGNRDAAVGIILFLLWHGK